MAVRDAVLDFAKLNHLRPYGHRLFFLLFLLHRVGDHAKPFLAQHVEHHRYGMSLPICTRLGLSQGRQVLRSPNYVHAYAHCQQPISVAVAGNVVGSMLVLPLTFSHDECLNMPCISAGQPLRLRKRYTRRGVV